MNPLRELSRFSSKSEGIEPRGAGIEPMGVGSC